MVLSRNECWNRNILGCSRLGDVTSASAHVQVKRGAGARIFFLSVNKFNVKCMGEIVICILQRYRCVEKRFGISCAVSCPCNTNCNLGLSTVVTQSSTVVTTRIAGTNNGYAMKFLGDEDVAHSRAVKSGDGRFSHKENCDSVPRRIRNLSGKNRKYLLYFWPFTFCPRNKIFTN